MLVGSLVALAPALIAIKGRPGWEDALLDLAGMLIPLVAFVPAPLRVGCSAGVETCTPAEVQPGVRNNVSALLVVGAVCLAFAWWSARPRGRVITLALVVATGVWLAFGLWFVVSFDTFLVGAHYAAAIAFFVLISAVAWINGRRAVERGNVRGMTPDGYARAYKVISLLMVLTIVVASVLYGGRGARRRHALVRDDPRGGGASCSCSSSSSGRCRRRRTGTRRPSRRSRRRA